MPSAEITPVLSGPAKVPSRSRSVFACSSSALRRIIFSSVAAEIPLGWLCQILLGSFPEGSFAMIVSFVKPARQDVLDPVHPHGNRRGREASDFSDSGGVHVFEIGNDHLPIERLELLNQR